MKGACRLIAFFMAASVIIGLLPLYSSAAVAGIKMSGTCHVQDVGDVEGVWDDAEGSLTLGTRGQGRRLEAITINLNTERMLRISAGRIMLRLARWREHRDSPFASKALRSA